MAEALRHDRSGVALAPPVQGTLYQGVAARTHAVDDELVYPWGKERRDAAELQRIVDQLPGKPLTLTHPDGLLLDGVPAKIIGKVVSAHLDGENAVVWLLVHDDAGNEAISDGMHELSLGYLSKSVDGFQRDIAVDHLALVPRGRCQTCALRADEMLHAKERNALPAEEFAVPGSRALPIHDEAHVRAAMSRFGETRFASTTEKSAAFHRIVHRAKSLGIATDGFEAAWSGRLDCDQVTPLAEPCKCRAIGYAGPEMATDPSAPGATDPKDKILMDELQKNLATALADAAKQKARADQAESERDALKTRADKAESDAVVAAHNAAKDLQVEKARADKAESDAKAALETARTDVAARLDASVAARVAVLTEANRVLGATDAAGAVVDRSKLTDDEIKIAIIKHVDGDDTDIQPAFIAGMYVGALKRAKVAAESRADARSTIDAMRANPDRIAPRQQTASASAEDAARLAMQSDTSNAHRTK